MTRSAESLKLAREQLIRTGSLLAFAARFMLGAQPSICADIVLGGNGGVASPERLVPCGTAVLPDGSRCNVTFNYFVLESTDLRPWAAKARKKERKKDLRPLPGVC